MEADIPALIKMAEREARRSKRRGYGLDYDHALSAAYEGMAVGLTRHDPSMEDFMGRMCHEMQWEILHETRRWNGIARRTNEPRAPIPMELFDDHWIDASGPTTAEVVAQTDFQNYFETLPEQLQQVISLRQQGLDFEEIGHTIGRSAATAHTLLRDARNRYAKYIGIPQIEPPKEREHGICVENGCEKEAKGRRGRCWTHYLELRETGLIRRHRAGGTCTECDKRAKTRGMCSAHYSKWNKARKRREKTSP